MAQLTADEANPSGRVIRLAPLGDDGRTSCNGDKTGRENDSGDDHDKASRHVHSARTASRPDEATVRAASHDSDRVTRPFTLPLRSHLATLTKVHSAAAVECSNGNSNSGPSSSQAKVAVNGTTTPGSYMASSSTRGNGPSKSNACSGLRRFSAASGRSVLPFHMLPFEVQAYHLQQQHNHPSISAMSRESEAHQTSPTQPTKWCNHTNSSPIRNAWFPLMPPAMAGQAPLPLLDNTPSSGCITAGTSVSSAREFSGGVAVGGTPTMPAAGVLREANVESKKSWDRQGDWCAPACVADLPGNWAASEIGNFVRELPVVSPTSTVAVVPCGLSRRPSPTKAELETQQRNDPTTADFRGTALALVATSGFSPVTVMQSLSMDLSNVCRAKVSWCLRVDESTPGELLDHLWPGSSSMTTVIGRPASVRSRLRERCAITRVKLEANNRAVTSASWPASMRRLEFGSRFNRPVEGVSWPAALEIVCFGNQFNQPVARVHWPTGLRELIFGNDFNQPVSGVNLPPDLKRLDFGERFNRHVDAVTWPQCIEELRFGHGFNRPIQTVPWPRSLLKLEFCGEFQQRIEDVVWPRDLQHLALLGDFDQAVADVKWPVRLTSIQFGGCFRQPLISVRWPPSLEKIILGCAFNQPLKGVEWPAGLKELTVPFERLLRIGGSDPQAEEGAYSAEHNRNVPASCKVEFLFDDDGVLEDSSDDVSYVPEDCSEGFDNASDTDLDTWADHDVWGNGGLDGVDDLGNEY